MNYNFILNFKTPKNMKTNNLIFKTDKVVGKEHIFVTIRLNDECKNGHEDFAITGDIYEAKKPKIDRYFIPGGCIHEDILKHFPEFKLFVDLHLSDMNGAPMYAIANGYYHLKNSSKEVVKEYLRINELEFNELVSSEDQFIFGYKLTKMNIQNRWKNEANQAIKQLEQLTGKEFASQATKSNFVYLSDEQIKDIEDKVNTGYYNAESIEERRLTKIEADKQKVIKDLKDRAKKDIDKINKELEIKLYIIDKGLSIDNVIFYDHSKEVVFNWSDSSYRKNTTKEEFDLFMTNTDLPKDVTFKFKSVKS